MSFVARAIEWLRRAAMRRPFTLKIDYPPSSRLWSFDLWWKITDHAFRFVQWCIVLGVISFAAEKSGNITLKILSAVLSLMVLLTASRLYSVRVSVTMHDLQRRPRVAKILSGALTYGTIFLMLDVGYRIVHSTYDALIAIQSVR